MTSRARSCPRHRQFARPPDVQERHLQERPSGIAQCKRWCQHEFSSQVMTTRAWFQYWIILYKNTVYASMMKSSRICHEPGTTGKLSVDPVVSHSEDAQKFPNSFSKPSPTLVGRLDGFAMNSSTSPDANSNALGEIYRNGGERKSKSAGQGCAAHQPLTSRSPEPSAGVTPHQILIASLYIGKLLTYNQLAIFVFLGESPTTF